MDKEFGGPTCARCQYMAVEWPDNPRAKRGRCYCRHKQAAEYQARLIPGSVRAPGYICKTAPGSETPTIQRPDWCPRSPRQAHGYSMREFRSLPLAERLRGNAEPDFTGKTMLGALERYVRTPNAHFQPMNANFGLLEPLGERVKGKRQRYEKLAERALATLAASALPKEEETV